MSLRAATKKEDRTPVLRVLSSFFVAAPRNGWTGGQYSLFRVIFGIYLLVHFAELVPWGAELFSNQGVLPAGTASPVLHLFPNVLAVWDSPAFVTVLLIAGTVLSALLALGWWDRLAAVALWYIWACLFGRNPLIANPGLPYVGWLLLAHACLPPAPYGSWAARGRPDPGGSWRMPQLLFTVAWILMALGYSYSGYTKMISPSWLDGTALVRVLNNPLARPGPVRDLLLTMPSGLSHLATWGALGLELSFAPLALVPRLRPILWSLLLAMHLTLIVVIDFADLSLGMVMVHLFTFNPAWIAPKAGVTEMIFYDGHCGLCLRLVRFVLAEDPTAATFHFAPLDSDAFRAAVPESLRAGLPDSVVIRTAQGSLLTRSAGALHILARLGGVWRLLGGLGRVVPRRLRDAGYDALARWRHHLFRRPAEVCPLIPARLRERFEF
jgi:predicted DCC family thiol-disulfide oxidoreductase YuxK